MRFSIFKKEKSYKCEYCGKTLVCLNCKINSLSVSAIPNIIIRNNFFVGISDNKNLFDWIELNVGRCLNSDRKKWLKELGKKGIYGNGYIADGNY